MPPAGKSAKDDYIEPYYTAKVTRDDPALGDGSAPPIPQLPCTFESVFPSLLTGVLGYIYGTGAKHTGRVETDRSAAVQLRPSSNATTAEV